MCMYVSKIPRFAQDSLGECWKPEIQKIEKKWILGEVLGPQFSRKNSFAVFQFDGLQLSERVDETACVFPEGSTTRRLENWKTESWGEISGQKLKNWKTESWGEILGQKLKNWILRRDLGPPISQKKNSFSVFQFLAQDLSSGLIFFSFSIVQFLAPYRPQNQAFEIKPQNSLNAL